MIQKVIFRQPAVEDIAEAAAWYDAHASGLRTTNRRDTESDTPRPG